MLSAEVRVELAAELGSRLERALRENPHYALARRLGQLAPVRVVSVTPDAAHNELRRAPGRLGDIKPRTLVLAPERGRG